MKKYSHRDPVRLSRNQKNDYTTKATKSTKLILGSQISKPFVGFVNFVMRMSFVKCCIHDE